MSAEIIVVDFGEKRVLGYGSDFYKSIKAKYNARLAQIRKIARARSDAMRDMGISKR